MNKSLLIGAIAALSSLLSASAAVVVAGDGSSATISDGGSSVTLTAVPGAFTPVPSGLSGTFSPYGSAGGVSVVGPQTITVSQIGGGITGGVLSNLKTFTANFSSGPIAANAAITSLSDYSLGGGGAGSVSGGTALVGDLTRSTGTPANGLLAMNDASSFVGTITTTGVGSGSIALHFGTAGTVVPEPSSVLLLGLGGFALFFRRRK